MKSQFNMPKLPIVSGKSLLKVLKKNGFIEIRQKGSHVLFKKVLIPVLQQ